MINIFKDLEKSKFTNHPSREHAKDYLSQLTMAVALLKDVFNKANSGVEVQRLVSTDCTATTAPIEINGKLITFKLAFNCDSESPFAVEIIEKEILKEVIND